MKLRKGDTIRVMAGKDRGREGKVEAIFQSEAEVFVPGLNQYKKHRKPQGEGKPGEIVTLSRPLGVANLALVCPKCKQVTRVGYSITGKKKVRICRKCKNEL